MTTAKLRNCSAYVNMNNNGFTSSYELVSYRTPVALLGMVDGEIVDVNGEIHKHEGMALLLNSMYDCSVTTMSHVRKFIEDYVGAHINIADIRQALKTDNMLPCYGNVAVFMVDSW